MNNITEVAAIVGLVAVIVMCSIMLVFAIRDRTFSQAPRRPAVSVESGVMRVPASNEVRHVD